MTRGPPPLFSHGGCKPDSVQEYKEVTYLFQPMKSPTGKLVGKWDSGKRILQIKRGGEISYFRITRADHIEAVAPPKVTLDASRPQ